MKRVTDPAWTQDGDGTSERGNGGHLGQPDPGEMVVFRVLEKWCKEHIPTT
jgi:hypothetical protein